MICVFMISVVLAVCNGRPQLSLKSGAANAITNNQVPIVEKMSFPLGTSGGNPVNSGGNPFNTGGNPFNTGGNPFNSGGNPVNKPLVAKSSSPVAYTDAMVRALAFMANGNVVLEQDDNGTPNNPFDDMFVMISERGERVDLSYSEIIMIRDVNHRLNSIFETTPGSVTPAITTVIQGASNSGQQRVLSAHSRSMSLNLGHSRSGNSGVGTAQIGYIPSRTVGQSGASNAYAGNVQFGSTNSGVGGLNAFQQRLGGNFNAFQQQLGGGFNAFQQQLMYKMQMKQRLKAMRYGMFPRMFLRPMIHPGLLRRFPF